MIQNRFSPLLAIAASLIAFIDITFAQGTAFTYQGRLNDGSAPAGGKYDLRFTIYDALTGGTAVGAALTNSGTAVSNGLFTVTLDFGVGVFAGANRWLEIAGRTNGGVTFVTLDPRQPLSASPYAIMAGNVSGVLSNSALPVAPIFSGTVTAGSFLGNGAGITNVNAAALGGLSSSAFWQLNGNAVGPATFLGSTNNQAVDIKVNGRRALRLQPTASDAPNIIGGSPDNFVRSDVIGATIGGGGSANYLGDPSATNAISSDFGTIGGGVINTIGGGAPHSVIGGGFLNTILAGAASTIGGGSQNFISNSASASTISGGLENAIHASSFNSAIGGGSRNIIASNTAQATIGGGYFNQVGGSSITTVGLNPGQASTIAGGAGNRIRENAQGSVISGGLNNLIHSNSPYATVGGGDGNTIRTNSTRGTISGGASNSIAAFSASATIAGGFNNRIGTNSPAISIGGGDRNNVGGSADGATIAGGVINNVGDNSYASAIGGGNLNFIGADSPGAVIAGGSLNQISVNAHHSIISGGDVNKIDANGRWNAIAGGYNNIIGTNTGNSVIGGGQFNTVSPGAQSATIPGGSGNTATNYAFAAGRQAMAIHTGAFVWADSQLADFASTAPNQALIRAAGGVGINNNNPGATLDVNGSLRVGSGTTVFSSLQGGAYQMTNTSSTARTNFTFTFPRPFTTAPKVLLTARNEPAQANATDTFVVSVRSVTTTTCTVNILRVDVAAGWGQFVMVDWLAWE